MDELKSRHAGAAVRMKKCISDHLHQPMTAKDVAPTKYPTCVTPEAG
ncbi:MAG: hypothetical protein QM451_05155 [Bacillota bacterium]|nr:hypothetical protein [Bacillota bacterium]